MVIPAGQARVDADATQVSHTVRYLQGTPATARRRWCSALPGRLPAGVALTIGKSEPAVHFWRSQLSLPGVRDSVELTVRANAPACAFSAPNQDSNAGVNSVHDVAQCRGPFR